MWKNINNKDYKIATIDLEQGIVVADGYYDISDIENPIYLGGKGNYFFYTGEKQNIELTEEEIENLTILTYGNDEN